MTESNQKRLYEHFVKLANDPKQPGEVVKQAKKNIEMMLKAYPHFAEKKEEKEIKKKKSKV